MVRTYAKRREAGNDPGRPNLHVDRAAGADSFTKLSAPYLHPPNKPSIITEVNDHCQTILRYYQQAKKTAIILGHELRRTQNVCNNDVYF